MTFTRPCLPLSAAALAVLALAAAPVRAAEDHSHHQHHMADKAAAKPVSGESVRIKLPDTALTDQDGSARRFATDVLGERIVVIDFVYTSCTTICPVASALFSQVQQQLGARVTQDVRLVSVSVDPVRDTPARLKEYGKRYAAGPGWSWLTGSKPQVDEVLRAFGAWTPNFENHPPLVMVGDPKAGKWMRFYGFPTPEQITAAVRDLGAARTKAG